MIKAVHTPGLSSAYWADEINGVDPITLIERGQFDVVEESNGQKRFWFVCPGPCKTLAAIALRPVTDGSQYSWDFDGNLQTPTLHPSINHVGCWHGWLKNGEFKEC